MHAGVGLIHRGEIIPNNSYILDSDIDEDLGAVQCVTDKVDCCRGGNIDSPDPHGFWYFPNGTQAPSIGGVTFQERHTAMTRLLHRDGYGVPGAAAGLYQCTILDKSNVDHNLYVGIYSVAEGTLCVLHV